MKYAWYCDISHNLTSPMRRAIYRDTSDSYTPAPFLDGKYYWRVEATDNSTVATSLLRTFIVRMYAGNRFPFLTYGAVDPETGYTDETYTFAVTFNDQDNDHAAWVRVVIDGHPYEMVEDNPFDVDTMYGKAFVYTTMLTVGNHNYSFMCSDGFSLNSTELYYGPNVSAVPPGRKMNKVTIQPDQTTEYAGGQFTGHIMITQENVTPKYEVYWYITLYNSDDAAINLDYGSSAILTTITVSYDVRVPNGTALGPYRLEARTYDRARNETGAEHLGTDSVQVTIGSIPSILQPVLVPILNAVRPLIQNSWLMWLIVIAMILLIVAGMRERRVALPAMIVGAFMIFLVVVMFIGFGTVTMTSWLLVAIFGIAFLVYMFQRGRGKKPNIVEPQRQQQNTPTRDPGQNRPQNRPMNRDLPKRPAPVKQGRNMNKAFAVIAIITVLAIFTYYGMPFVINRVSTAGVVPQVADASYTWRRQEDPDLSTFPADCVDGDWSTGDLLTIQDGGSYYYNNYGIPHLCVGAVWEVRDGYGYANYSMPEDALTEPIVKIQGMFNASGSGTIIYQAYYGSVWHTIATETPATNMFYDEAIRWKFTA